MPSPAPVSPVPYSPPWFQRALAERGVHETVGPHATPRILQYHSATSLKAQSDEVAWCSAFVCWCLRECGIHSTENAMARSYLLFGRELTEPETGCIVVLRRGAPPAGHVGFFVDRHDGMVYVWGGNQGDRVGMARFPESDVLAYRWPAAA